MRRLLFLFILIGLLQPVASAQQAARDTLAADSALQVSLLTCSPGHAPYELYGHTAIRVSNPSQGMDLVFNYGVFDFYQPHFVWHFVLGECDYLLYPFSYDLFMSEYAARGSSVTEQVLNLLPQEAEALLQDLVATCSTTRRQYRYNIFRSNCTTKARDIIEANIAGEVIYPVRVRRNTFRSILHQFTRDHAWDREGNDLLLGADVDTLITERDEMFSPIYMMWYADSAMIYRGYHRYDPLVRERRTLLEANPELAAQAAAREPSFPVAPPFVWWSVVACGLLLAVWEVRRCRAVWAVDMVLLLLQGFAGLLITFMLLFSTHPGVASNWQVWVLNPLPLLFVVPVVRAARRSQPCAYHRVAAALLLLFVVLYPVLPQHFSTLMLPLALLLLSRAIVHILIDRFRLEDRRPR